MAHCRGPHGLTELICKYITLLWSVYSFVEQIMFHHHSDRGGSHAYGHDSQPVYKSVYVLLFPGEHAVYGFSGKTVGSVEHFEAYGQFLQIVRESEEIGRYASGASHGDHYAIVFHLIMKGT